jgi:Tol biopolymer transport system component
MTELPASEGLSSPAWSPDGRYVAAVSESGRTLLLFEFATGRWTAVAEANAVSHGRWSPDSRSLYFQDWFGSAQTIYRVAVPGGKAQALTSGAVFPAGVTAYGFAGVTPSGSLLGTLIRNNSDLYAMKLEGR